MRVVVKFHESARADYEAWQAHLSQPPTGNPGIASLHAEELTRELQRTGGAPAGALFRVDLDPPSWVWRFTAETWVRFVRRERRLGLWGGVVVEVIVTAVLTPRAE